MSRRAARTSVSNDADADAGAGPRLRSRPRRDSDPDLDADKDSTDSDHNNPSPSKEKERNASSYLSRWTPTNIYFLVCIISIVVIALALTKVWTDKRNGQVLLKSSILNISAEFPAQPKEMWINILSILETVGSGENACPKAILLLDKGDEQSRATSTCLVSKVAKSSSHILQNGAEPLKLGGEELGSLDDVRNEIQNHDIIVIEHLENLSAKSAQALHFICDENDDSFGKAAYFLTLTVKNNEKAAIRAAESTLRSLWPEMEWDYREALIARITSLVVFVSPEVSIAC